MEQTRTSNRWIGSLRRQKQSSLDTVFVRQGSVSITTRHHLGGLVNVHGLQRGIELHGSTNPDLKTHSPGVSDN